MELIQVEQYQRQLAELTDPHSVLKISDQAAALKDALKRCRYSLKDVNKVAALWLWANRRAGELLEQKAPHGGDRARLSGLTLKDLDISKPTSANLRRHFKIDETEFRKFIAICEAEEVPITMKGLFAHWADILCSRRQTIEDIYPPEGKYRIIYCDPPWKYEKGKQLSPWKYGNVEKHYRVENHEDIAEIPINDIAHKNCVCFMWATAPKLPEALFVMEEWGFQYKTNIIWNKVRHNFGYYFSMRHELLLIGGIGKTTPDIKELKPSVIEIERSARHSEKPDFFRELIDSLYYPPDLGKDRIELFARHENLPIYWETWGLEIDS